MVRTPRPSRLALGLLLVASALFVAACSSEPKSTAQIRSERKQLEYNAKATVERFRREAPDLERYFDDAHAYAVFPTVGKGAFIVGGAHGKGVVFEPGVLGTKVTGECELTQGSIGLAIGGQSFSQLIFFESEGPLNRFKAGKTAMAAKASAVAAGAGATAEAKYEDGVAVFVLGESGLMAEAAVGGQRFDYLEY